MQYRYCLCGGRTPVDGISVKFCCICGKSFDGVAQTSKLKSPKKSEKRKKTEEVIEEVEIEEDIDDIDDIEEEEEDTEEEDRTINAFEITDMLDYEVSGPRKLKLGDIAGTITAPTPIDQSPASSLKKVSSKKFFDNWSKEAGTLRPKR